MFIVLNSCSRRQRVGQKWPQLRPPITKLAAKGTLCGLSRKLAISEGSSDTERIGILWDLGNLLARSIVPIEMQRQVEPLANVSPSLGDSDVAGHRSAAHKYGDNNSQ